MSKKPNRKRSKGSIGIVGLGIMGGAFAKNLSSAGWRVVGYDNSAAACKAAERAGVEIAGSAADVAAMVPAIITSLPKPKALDATVRAIAKAKLPRRVIVEMSTFTLEDKESAERVLRKAGHVMLDCPVSGTGAQAKTKDLVFYASGDRRSIAKLRPLFKDFGRAAYDLGAFGNGSRMKYVANLLVAIHNVASAEAMVLGMKSGLEPKMIYDLISAGVGTSRIFELRGPKMVKNDYTGVTMKVSVWQKDMQVIGDFAKKLGVPTPLLSATKPIYEKALAGKYAEQDTASVCAVLEAMAGFKRSKARA
jgi:3-hydroxyisobutyrate dehydrogenase-like beta-hydroxyacid dehydrogenase